MEILREWMFVGLSPFPAVICDVIKASPVNPFRCTGLCKVVDSLIKSYVFLSVQQSLYLK